MKNFFFFIGYEYWLNGTYELYDFNAKENSDEGKLKVFMFLGDERPLF